jgi:nucleotide-binding universal stress UspA family protein
MVIDEAEKDLIQRVAKTKKAYERKKNSSKDIKVATEVIHGMSEAVTISNYARKNNIDLIAIHTHGRSGITKFLLGSVTERVLSSSKCSVLAMRPD